MSLPTPKLDDRTFQQIVDEVKAQIPRRCPEWTDHNVSDPGIALVELFAWMTEMMLYRVNQLPDKVYVKFLDMLGIKLAPPRAAYVPITLYLSAAQASDIVIPAGTEVATVRTETSPAIAFTTEDDLVIRPPQVISAYTRRMSQGAATWQKHDISRLSAPNQRVPVFSDQPAPGDAFFIGLRQSLANHVVALVLNCELAGGAGVDPHHPPVEWQVWMGNVKRWVACDVEHDGTWGFNKSGEVILRLRGMVQGEFPDSKGEKGFWLRCRLTDAQAGSNSYRVTPFLKQMRIETRGGTVGARQMATAAKELISDSSDGTPGQTFRLQHTPILALDPKTECLIVEAPGQPADQWQEVSDFADSGPRDKHYTLDSLDGALCLGPALLQPDGSVYCFGAVPPKGSRLSFSRYRYGGGQAGNVAAQTLTVLKTAIPYVARVINWEAAHDGRDAETLAQARLRAPQALRTRSRAVTEDDYEFITCQHARVARARCIAPGPQPGAPGSPPPGQVWVVILPRIDNTAGPIQADRMTPSAELRAELLSRLNACRLLGTSVDVRVPQFTWISVQARLRLAANCDPADKAEVQQWVEAELYRYLNPYVGGPHGNGWPFGRALHRSELFGLLQRHPRIDFVDSIDLFLSDPSGATPQKQAPPAVAIPAHGLICSAQHQVTIL